MLDVHSPKNRPLDQFAPSGSLVRMRSLSALEPLDFARWNELAKIALDGNPFAASSFVISVNQHLKDLSDQPLVLSIEQEEAWIGCGVFSRSSGTRHLPLPHLIPWKCKHTFLDGLLLHRDHAAAAAEHLFEFLKKGTHTFHGIEFESLATDSISTQLLEAAAQSQGITCWAGHSQSRAALRADVDRAESLVQSMSLQRVKSLKKGWRELQKRGEPHFRLVGIDGTASAAELIACGERLLHLESLGWKGEQETALLSRQQESAFFRQMLRELAKHDNVFFSELCVGEEVIGSVVHLVSGNQAFAFKLGWNPDYERGCPGFQMKALMAAAFEEHPGRFSLIDSCSKSGSFIERVWPHRRQVGPRVFATSPAGQLTLGVTGGLHWVKDRFWLTTEDR